MEYITKSYFWPTKMIDGIPLSDLISEAQNTEHVYKKLQKTNIYLDKKVVDFILTLCMIGNLNVSTSESAVLAFHYAIIKDKTLIKSDLELVAIACVLLSSKMFDRRPMPLSLIHKATGHYYNNANILAYENRVLSVLNYKIFFRDDLPSERMGLYLESIRNIFYEGEFKVMEETCGKIMLLLYEDRNFFKVCSIDMLAVGTIQAAYILRSKREANFPFTYKLAALSGVDVEIIKKLSHKILIHCLGKDVYKQFTF